MNVLYYLLHSKLYFVCIILFTSSFIIILVAIKLFPCFSTKSIKPPSFALPIRASGMTTTRYSKLLAKTPRYSLGFLCHNYGAMIRIIF